MTPGIEAARPAPRAFLSYAWESDPHRQWVRDFATRLRADGVNVTLDQWNLQPGDQLPAFMERAVRENDYVIIVCTPTYAERSNERRGGVGYEGDIMTAEVLNEQNQRKFIPIYRNGNTWEEASPTWLRGKYRIDLRGNPYGEEQYQDLLTTLHGLRPTAPPVGARPARLGQAAGVAGTTALQEPPPTEPIRIIGVVVDEVTSPRRDGTRGSALYRIPFQLSRRPSREWAERFIPHWNEPPQWTTMHRPGIANVSGDKIYLNGTTMEEVERYHRDTLKLAIQETNREVAEYEQQQHAIAEQARKEREDHERAVREAAQRIKFD
jgi:TIR domain